MGGLSDFLFGSKPKTVTNTLPTILPEQEALLKQLLATLTPGGSTTVPYTGQFTAPTTPTENAGLTVLDRLMQGYLPKADRSPGGVPSNIGFQPAPPSSRPNVSVTSPVQAPPAATTPPAAPRDPRESRTASG